MILLIFLLVLAIIGVSIHVLLDRHAEQSNPDNWGTGPLEEDE